MKCLVKVLSDEIFEKLSRQTIKIENYELEEKYLFLQKKYITLKKQL